MKTKTASGSIALISRKKAAVGQTTLTCVCGFTESAPKTEDLHAKGWRELYAEHCESCSCGHYYCPAHAPIIEAVLKGGWL